MVKLQYGVALPKKDTPHFIQNEGLDKDVEKIFDDMIKYKGKLDRGKSLAGIDNHKTIKDQLDNIIEKSK